jgi:hypothetical protein
MHALLVGSLGLGISFLLVDAMGCPGSRVRERAGADGARVTDSDEWRRSPANEPCRAKLRALFQGRLGEWTGLEGCERVDVESVLGEGTPSPNPRSGIGELTLRYAAQPAAPAGVLAWYQGSAARVLLLNPVALSDSPDRFLGKPELVRPSQVNEGMEEWIWAGRGISAQIRPLSGDAASIQVFAPLTLAAFLASPLARSPVIAR